MVNPCKTMCKIPCIFTNNFVYNLFSLKFYPLFQKLPTILLTFFHYISSLYLANFIHYSTTPTTTTKLINNRKD